MPMDVPSQLQKALARWGIADANVTLLAQRENWVYRVEPNMAPAVVLRFHRPGYRTEVELLSELQWLAYLTEQGLCVPQPIVSAQQKMLEPVGGFQVSCLSHLSGVALGQTGQPLAHANRNELFYRLGATVATLHTASDAWKLPRQLTRSHWDRAGLLGKQALWGSYQQHPQITQSQHDILDAASARAEAHLRACENTLDYGLIHADLVRENILIATDGQIQLLDFDDGGFGFRLFELATALLKNSTEANYPALEHALLSGYRSQRPIDSSALPLFLFLRASTYLGWIVPRLHEAGGQQRSQRFINTAIKFAKNYLDG